MCKEFSQQLVPFLFSISFFFVSRKLLGILRTHFISCPRMEQESNFLSTTRYALVTGGNKGIGFEICKQLASQGVRVVLTARDEKRGLEAVEKLLKESGLTDHFVFHQLDVVDPSSVASVADFVNTKFGKLDILINNAGVGGVILDADAFARAAELAGGVWPKEGNWSEIEIPTYEKGEECLKTNYYGSKTMIEAFLPLLQASDSARVVNVSSSLGSLKNIPNEWAKEILSDVENLSEERIDEVLREFLKDMKDGMVETKGWPKHLSAYKLSKAALNACTRVLAKRYKKICFNSVCPGYVKTDITCNTGQLTVAEGAQSVVRLALLPNDKLNSGLFFHRQQVSSF